MTEPELFRWSKSPPPTFFVLTNLGHFDFKPEGPLAGPLCYILLWLGVHFLKAEFYNAILDMELSKINTRWVN